MEQQHELDYSQITNILRQGLIVLDRNLRIVLWNRWMEEQSRLSCNDVLGKLISDLYPELLKKGFFWKIRNVFELGNYAFFSQKLHGYLFPFPATRFLGSDIQQMQQNVAVAPLRSSNGIIDYVCISIVDNTDAVIYRERLESVSRRIEEMSRLDYLTRLPNRRHLFERLEAELSRQKRTEVPLSLAMVDIDFFKMINDTYGHLCGDRILVQLADQLRLALRKYDFVGRYGGEEFCIVLPECRLDDAFQCMERLRASVNQTTFTYDETSVDVTVSIGITSTEGLEFISTDTLLQQADKYLYEAKKSGRNRIRYG